MGASRWIARLLAAFLLGAPLLTAHAVDQATTQSPAVHHKFHKKPLPPLVLPPLPSGPLRPVPMDQLPAAAPQVTYQDGLLAIAAQNATLGEILRDVRKLTGATIEMPSGAGGERVVVQLGPGAPRDVLALLLNGTSFNYVMLGTISDPNAVASVSLSLKGSPPGETQTVASAPTPTYETPERPMMPVPPLAGVQAFRQQPLALKPAGQLPAPQAANAEESSDDDDDKDDDSDQSPPVQPGQPAVMQPDANSDQASDQANSGPKTPDQLLQMMRQQQPGNGPLNGPLLGPPNGPQNGPPPQQ